MVYCLTNPTRTQSSLLGRQRRSGQIARWLAVASTIMIVGASTWSPVMEENNSLANKRAVVVDTNLTPVNHLTVPAPNEEHNPFTPALKLIKSCQKQFESIDDYSTTMLMQERIKGRLMPAQTIAASFRHEPFSVHFHWQKPDPGQEVIYVEGQNNGKMLYHGTGLLRKICGTLRLDPEGTRARQTSRHSIRDAGIRNLIDQLITRWEFERQFKQTEVTIRHVKLNDRPCYEIKTVHPHPNNGQFMYHTAKIYIDKQLNFPVHFEGYAYPKKVGHAPGPLEATYTYQNVQINLGLTDDDFSADNPKFGYSRF